MLQQLLLSPPQLPAAFDLCQGGGCCSCSGSSSSSSSSYCEDPSGDPFLQQACCLAAVAGERACGRCAAYAQLLRLQCDSSPSLGVSPPPPPLAAALCHLALPKSHELERAAAAAAAVAPADRHRCAGATVACCCCCLYYGNYSSNSSEVWGPLPVSLAEDISCDFANACDSCVALRDAPSPLDDGRGGQLWGPEEEAWGPRPCWPPPSRCADTGTGGDPERRTAAAGVGALLLQLPSNLICDAALLTSAPSPLNAGGGHVGPLPASRSDVAGTASDGCQQQRRATAQSSRNSNASTCCCPLDCDVLMHCRGEAVNDLLLLESDLLLHTDAAATLAAFPHCCEAQQLQQQQPDPHHFEQLSPFPMSSCASRCASPLQQTQSEKQQPQEQQQLLQEQMKTQNTPSSGPGDCGKADAAGQLQQQQQQQQQLLAAGRKSRMRRRRTSETSGRQRQQQQQETFAAAGCCCARQPCVCPQRQHQTDGFFSQESEGAAGGHTCCQGQQNQESLVLPVQKRKRLTCSTLAESSCDEWTVGQLDQWSCDGPGPQSLLLSSEEQQQQLSPASFYDFSCSPTTAAPGVQHQQHQGSSSQMTNCTECGAAANCCCCSAFGLEQQQSRGGLRTLVDGGLSRQLSHISHDSVPPVAAVDAPAGCPSKDCSKDSSPNSAAPSPKAAAATTPVTGGGPFVCNVDIPVCLPQFEEGADCLSLLNLTEAQWQQFRAQGMFKLGDKGRAIIKSRISRCVCVVIFLQ